MLESGVSRRMYRCFLHYRSARVKLDGHLIKSMQNARSPTGRSHLTGTLSPVHQQHHDCASPTCLQHHTCRWSRRVECIWIHHIFCLQIPGSCEQGRAVNKWLGSLDQWSEDTSHSFLPLHPQRKSRHKAWRQDTTPSRDPHLFRVKLDTRLSWKLHIEDMETKGIKKLAGLKKLSGTHWGVNSKILKTVYMGAVRPSLEYGASAWATAANTHTNKLEKVQSIGLRTIIGAMKTASVAEMEKTAGVEPLESRRQAKLLIHAETTKRMPDHPLHQKLKDPSPLPPTRTQNKLKRKSLNHIIKERQMEHADILTTDAHLCEKSNQNSWPPETLQAEIRTTIPGITSKENQREALLRPLALEEIDKHYPTASWTHIYTVDSNENATRNVGCGAYIKRPGKPPFSVSAPGGILGSNYRAEVLALFNATETIVSYEEKPKKAVFFLTASLSALKPSCLVNLKQRKRCSQRTSAPSLSLPGLFISGYQHTPVLGEMK